MGGRSTLYCQGEELVLLDLEGVKEEDLMVTMAGAMHKQLNLHLRLGNTNDANYSKSKYSLVNETVVSKSKINRDEVIIEDWTLDDEDDVCAVKTVSSIKPNVITAVGVSENIGYECGSILGWRVVKNSMDYCKRAGLVNTDRSNVSTARSISTIRPGYTVRPVSTARPLASKIAQYNSVIRPNHPRLDI
ncbi:hypothetical protein Tco_0312474, partial [Tanacetum coccineum]